MTKVSVEQPMASPVSAKNIARVAKSCPESGQGVKVFLLKDVIITTSVTTVIFITITI